MVCLIPVKVYCLQSTRVSVERERMEISVQSITIIVGFSFCKNPAIILKYELQFGIISVDKFMCRTNKHQNFHRDQSAIKQADNSQSEITRVELESPDNFRARLYLWLRHALGYCKKLWICFLLRTQPSLTREIVKLSTKEGQM